MRPHFPLRAKTISGWRAARHDAHPHPHLESQAEIETIRENTAAPPGCGQNGLHKPCCRRHCMYLTDSDIQLFARQGTSIATNPCFASSWQTA